MQGPADALKTGMNAASNAAGMAAVTGASVAGFLGRITSSANRVILAISMDEEYIHAKEIKDIREKPKSGMDGF